MPRYQYQPLTGPVWREPVAAGLSWLPQAPMRGRSLPAVTLGALAASFFAVLPAPSYDPQDLAWQPRIAVAARTLPFSPQSLSILDPTPPVDPALLTWLPSGGLRVQPRAPAPSTWSLLNPFPLPPPSYDPTGLQWLPAGRAQPSRTLAAAPWNDATTAGTPVYDPQELQWIPVTAWPLRTLAATRAGSTVLDPFPRPSVAFDPALFPWTEARAPRAPIERRALGETVQPFTAALYQPEFLQWLPPDWSRPPRALARAGQTWDILSPFPIAPPTFDPAHLAWTPGGRAPLRLVQPVRPSSVVLDPLPVAAPAPTPSPTEPPGGGKVRKPRGGRRAVVEPHVTLAKPEAPAAPKRPRKKAPPVVPAVPVAPAPPFTIPVLPTPPAPAPGTLPPPSAEGIVLAGLAPDLAALNAVVAQSAEDRLRLLLFAVVTLS